MMPDEDLIYAKPVVDDLAKPYRQLAIETMQEAMAEAGEHLTWEASVPAALDAFLARFTDVEVLLIKHQYDADHPLDA